MIFWVSNFLTTVNLILAAFTYFKNHDIAHLALAAIYSIVIGPVFAVCRWRFKQGIRYVPMILFVTIATYISVGSLGVSKKMMQGLDDGNEQFSTLFYCYIICTYILGQSDFKLALFLFPLFMIASVIVNLSRQKKYEIKISLLPSEYRRLIDPIIASQQIKVAVY